MSWYKPSNLFDKVFEGGIIIKGIDGLLEFLAGLMALFVSPLSLHNFVSWVTHRELVGDPHDKFATLLVHATNRYSSNGRVFLIIYLWLHAAIKLVAVIGILRDLRWAYPFSLISLGLLTMYQFYDIFFVKMSLGMILLTIFDIAILWLIWREYTKRYRHPAAVA